jgi:hypothetical protein
MVVPGEVVFKEDTKVAYHRGLLNSHETILQIPEMNSVRDWSVSAGSEMFVK